MWLHIDSCSCVPFGTFWSLCPEHPGGFTITPVFISALMSLYELTLPFIPNCSPADTVTRQPGRRAVPRQTQGKTSRCDQMDGAGGREQGTMALKGCCSENMIERQPNSSSSELVFFYLNWQTGRSAQMDICRRDGGSFLLCTSMHVHACMHTCTESHIRTGHEPSILHMSKCISLFTTHVQ